MKPSAYYDRVVDVVEELFKFTLLVRARTDYLASRYSKRAQGGRREEQGRAARGRRHEA